MKWFLSSGAWYLWLALDNCDAWDVRDCQAVYKKGLTMWVGNGAFFFDGYGSGGTPPFTGCLERHLLWWKYKRMVQNQMACHITKLMTGEGI